MKKHPKKSKEPVKLKSKPEVNRLTPPSNDPVRRAPSVVIARTIPEALHIALEHTKDATIRFGDRLRVLLETETIEQVDLETGALFDQLEKTAKKGSKGFDDMAKELHHRAEQKRIATLPPGAKSLPEGEQVRIDVAPGARVLVFKDNRKINVGWKGIAAEHAKALHAVAAAFAKNDKQSMRDLLAPFAGPFDEKVWEERIKAGIEKTGPLTPEIAGG